MHPPTMVAAAVSRPPWYLTPCAATNDNHPTYWVTVLCGGAGSGAPWQPLLAIFRSRRVDGRCGVLVVCVLHRNTWGSVPANWQCLPGKVRKSNHSALELSARQPPHQMGRCATSAKQGHHGGMMCCGGGVKEDGTGAGGDYSYSMRTRASIDSFNIDIFALDLSWNSSGSGAAILCLQHLLKVSGRTLTILYKVITNW